jgi:AraC family transcriptional regulator
MAEQRLLFDGKAVSVGEFHCGPDDPLWTVENVIVNGPVIVFPGTPVWIEHAGKQPFVADRNQALFYDDGQRYRRHPLAPTGDHCVFLRVSPALLREATARCDPSAGSARPLRFPVPTAYLDVDTFFAKERVVARLASGNSISERGARRALSALARRALDAAYRRRAQGWSRIRPATRQARAEAVETARALLAGNVDRPLPLSALAREVHLSPDQIARIFRAHTGISIHQYRTQLRLRASLPQLRREGTDLASVAASLGYKSHSHFTESFRRTFGTPPSQAARLLRDDPQLDRPSITEGAR